MINKNSILLFERSMLKTIRIKRNSFKSKD